MTRDTTTDTTRPQTARLLRPGPLSTGRDGQQQSYGRGDLRLTAASTPANSALPDHGPRPAHGRTGWRRLGQPTDIRHAYRR